MDFERALLERVVTNDRDARARFSAHYRDPMLKIWEQRRPKSCSADLDSDFVHWFLIEWIARPDDSWGNLKKFLSKNTHERSPKFLAWWAATARHRFSDFYREKIRSRFEQRAIAEDEELDRISETTASDPEREMIVDDALVALGECFDHFLDRSDVRIECRLLTNLSVARPHASASELLETLKKLGFEVREGELASRRGRVAARLRGAAMLIGRCLSARGFTADEVRSALPSFVDTLAAAE